MSWLVLAQAAAPQVETKWIILGGAGVAVLIVLGIVLGVAQARRRREKTAEWQAFAGARGLTCSGTWPVLSLSGAVDGIQVSLQQRVEVTHHQHHQHHGRRSSSAQRRVVSELVARPAVATGDLGVGREGFWDMLGKAFGGQDVQLGDPAFDKMFRVTTSQPAMAPALLTPAARQALLAAQEVASGLGVAGGAVRWKGGNVKETERALELMAVAARAAALLGR
jgi:hypothetical protein